MAYAAYRQGKFWEISDLLFQHQQDWADAADPSPYFDAYGTQIGLDMSTFHQDARAQETVDFINKQILEADKVGIGHTPSFFLNGTSIDPDGPDALGPLLRDRL